jgi:hypothetical protein
MKPEKPSIMGMAEFEPSAKCPSCSLIMYLGNRCPHCDHLLSQPEQKAQKLFWIKVRNNGYKKGLVFFSSLILVIWWVYGT